MKGAGTVKPRVWILSELYHPEATSTGHVITRLAEGLASDFDVNVLCAQPTYSQRGVEAPAHEMRNGVHIRRCWSARLDKNRLGLKLINILTFSLSILAAALFHTRRGDVIVAVTTPPLLPFIARVVSLLRGARLVVLVQDVYPDVLVTTGLRSPDALSVRMLRSAARRLYRSVSAVCVCGRDMAEVLSRYCSPDVPIFVVPNWGEIDTVQPAPRETNAMLRELRLQNRFVVLYAGNLGLPNDVDVLCRSAELVREDTDIHFLIVGGGTRSAELNELIRERGLDNISAVGARPRHEQPIFLNACDLAVHTFIPGMFGLGVPSRMYNVMAAGKPLVALVDAGSEPARVIDESRSGWVLAPGDAQGLARVIRAARGDRAALLAMGRHAREQVERRYTEERAVAAYAEVLQRVIGGRSHDREAALQGS